MVSNDRSPQQILVCQNRTCRKQGSAKVLAAFREYSIDGGTGETGTGETGTGETGTGETGTGETGTGETPVLRVEGCGCLGRCGSGPMVVVLPDEVWYCGVRVDEVPAILERYGDRAHLD